MTPTGPARASAAGPARSAREISATERRRTCRRLAFAVRLAGAVTVVSAVSPPQRHRIRLLALLVPHAVIGNATALSAISGTVLLLVAGGIRHGKRRAFLAAAVALAVAVMTHLLKGLDVEESGMCAAVLGWLLWRRGRFVTRPDPVSRWRPWLLMVGLAAFSTAAGVVLLLNAGRAISGTRTVGSLTVTAVLSLAGRAGPVHLLGRRGDTIGDVIAGLGVLTAIVPVWAAVRAVRAEGDVTANPGLAAALLRGFPADSLGYFALRDDRALVALASGKAAVSYRLVGRVALAAGDPLGDPDAWPEAIRLFLDRTDQHDWIPAVLGATERGARAYDRAGLACLELGEEAIVQPAIWRSDGRDARSVRQAVARVGRAGYTAQILRNGELLDGQLAELRGLAVRWRAGDTERGYSMALGRLGDRRDADALIAVARDAEGTPRALLQLVPWGPDGLSLDLMRRDPAAVNGVTEFLICAVVAAAEDLGIQRISLNFVMLRDVLARGARLGAGPLLRFYRRLLLMTDRWWQIERLHRFNAKFSPFWCRRYLCYPGAADLPQVTVGALRAEAFLPALTRRERLGGRARAPAACPRIRAAGPPGPAAADTGSPRAPASSRT